MTPDPTPIDADETEAAEEETQTKTVWCDWDSTGAMIGTYSEAIQHLSSADPQLDEHRERKGDVIDAMLRTLEQLDLRVRLMLAEQVEDV